MHHTGTQTQCATSWDIPAPCISKWSVLHCSYCSISFYVLATPGCICRSRLRKTETGTFQSNLLLCIWRQYTRGQIKAMKQRHNYDLWTDYQYQIKCLALFMSDSFKFHLLFSVFWSIWVTYMDLCDQLCSSGWLAFLCWTLHKLFNQLFSYLQCLYTPLTSTILHLFQWPSPWVGVTRSAQNKISWLHFLSVFCFFQSSIRVDMLLIIPGVNTFFLLCFYSRFASTFLKKMREGCKNCHKTVWWLCLSYNKGKKTWKMFSDLWNNMHCIWNIFSAVQMLRATNGKDKTVHAFQLYNVHTALDIVVLANCHVLQEKRHGHAWSTTLVDVGILYGSFIYSLYVNKCVCILCVCLCECEFWNNSSHCRLSTEWTSNHENATLRVLS